MNTPEKNYNLELIRMCSFMMVVLIHVTNYYCRAYGQISLDEYIFAMALDNIARISVPCFFMLTGALLLGREESLEKHAKRLLRFLIASIAWSLIYYIWNRFVMHSHYDVPILFEPMEQHLWYLYAMIAIYLVLPFYQVMCRHLNAAAERALLVIITLAVSFNYLASFVRQEAYYDLPLVGDRPYMFYIFVGYYLYKYRRKLPGRRLIAALLFALCMLFNMGLTLYRTIATGAYWDRMMEYANPVLALAAAMFFCLLMNMRDGKWLPGPFTQKLINLFCGCSFGIYLSHILFLDTYKRFIKAADISAYIAIPPLTAAIILLSFAFVWLLRKTKPGRAIT